MSILTYSKYPLLRGVSRLGWGSHTPHVFYCLGPVVARKIKFLEDSTSLIKKHQKSKSSSYALAALKTKGLEKSLWTELYDLAEEVHPLDLGEGFPNFAAPDYLVKELANCATDKQNVLLNQRTRSIGHPRLVNALGKLYSMLLGRFVDAENEILINLGATEGLYCVFNGLVNPGDEVILIEPFFNCYVPQVILAGGTPVFVPLRPAKTEGQMSSSDWKFDPAELSNAFSHRTKAIVVNTPNNPLGKVFSLGELTFIADLCKKHNAVAIMDEVYQFLTYGKVKHIRMASLPGMWDRCVTLSSAGKMFSTTGWRVGWAIGPKELLAGPKIIHHNCVLSCDTPIQEAFARALELETSRLDTPECYSSSLRADLARKRQKMIAMLAQTGFNPVVPDGAYFVMADATRYTSKLDLGGDPSEPDDFRFVKWLCRNRNLLALPPSAFFSGPNKGIGGNYIRFCYIKEHADLDKAAQILSQLKADVDAGRVN